MYTPIHTHTHTHTFIHILKWVRGAFLKLKCVHWLSFNLIKVCIILGRAEIDFLLTNWPIKVNCNIISSFISLSLKSSKLQIEVGSIVYLEKNLKFTIDIKIWIKDPLEKCAFRLMINASLITFIARFKWLPDGFSN